MSAGMRGFLWVRDRDSYENTDTNAKVPASYFRDGRPAAAPSPQKTYSQQEIEKKIEETIEENSPQPATVSPICTVSRPMKTWAKIRKIALYAALLVVMLHAFLYFCVPAAF